MKPSESVGSWQQQTLVEAIRLRETLWGPVEDLSESRRARAAGGSFAQRVSARALALARRDGLEQAWTRWWRIARLLLIAMAVLALLAGAGTAAGALGDGSRAVNVVTAVGALLGLHALTFIFWLFSLVWSGKGAGTGSWAGDAWWWLSRRFVKGDASLVPQAFAAVLARRGSQSWLAGLISHSLWVLAFLSALSTLLLLLASRRYHFNWETTLLTPDTFVWLVEGLGALPSLLGFAQPDTLTIRSSDGLQVLDAQAQAVKEKKPIYMLCRSGHPHAAGGVPRSRRRRRDHARCCGGAQPRRRALDLGRGAQAEHWRGSALDHPVRVEHVLLGGSLVEVLVSVRGLVQRDDRGVHRLCDLRAIVQDHLHQAVVVPHHRALARREAVRLRPAQADPDRQRAHLGRIVEERKESLRDTQLFELTLRHRSDPGVEVAFGTWSGDGASFGRRAETCYQSER